MEPGAKEEQSQYQLLSFSSSEVKEQSGGLHFPPLTLPFLGLASGPIFGVWGCSLVTRFRSGFSFSLAGVLQERPGASPPARLCPLVNH